MLKVNTVCINGMGSSLILKMTVEKAFKELGIDAQVTHMDAGQFKGRHLPDVCITTPSLARTIGGAGGDDSDYDKEFYGREGNQGEDSGGVKHRGAVK